MDPAIWAFGKRYGYLTAEGRVRATIAHDVSAIPNHRETRLTGSNPRILPLRKTNVTLASFNGVSALLLGAGFTLGTIPWLKCRRVPRCFCERLATALWSHSGSLHIHHRACSCPRCGRVLLLQLIRLHVSSRSWSAVQSCLEFPSSRPALYRLLLSQL